MRVPESIRPGAVVAVVAPASPFPREELMRGLAWLRTRYRLRVSTGIFARDGYLAGDDARRASELSHAMIDPEVDAIVSVRGGYGAIRLLDALPWEAFAARPKWLVGFSDITALHVEANTRGVATIHGPSVTWLGQTVSPAERLAFIDCLEGHPPSDWHGLTVLRPGRARGPIIGGNLAMAAAMAAANRFSVPEGAVLAFEDVTERPYRIDRMLTSLRLGGHLARAAAIVFGGFTKCEAGPDGVTVEHVLRERTASLDVPVIAGAPFGHAAPNVAFPLGAMVTVDGASLRFG